MIRLRIVHTCCRQMSSAAPAARLPDFHKSEQNGTAHVTSLNVHSGDRSIVEISRKEGKRPRRLRREFQLPEASVSGLKQAIVDCKVTPKQLQHEADQLTEKLSQRRFPAAPEVVKRVRDEIKKKLEIEREKRGEGMDDDLLLDEKIFSSSEL